MTSTKLLTQKDFVFLPSDGTAIEHLDLLKNYIKLLKKVETPKIRLHDLCHTTTSLMDNNGVDVLVASQRLGHAPKYYLRCLWHLMHSMQNEAAKIIDSLATE